MALKKVNKVQAPSQAVLSVGQNTGETTSNAAGNDVLSAILQKITAMIPEAVVHVDEKVSYKETAIRSPLQSRLCAPLHRTDTLPSHRTCLFPRNHVPHSTHHPTRARPPPDFRARRIKTFPPPILTRRRAARASSFSRPVRCVSRALRPPTLRSEAGARATSSVSKEKNGLWGRGGVSAFGVAPALTRLRMCLGGVCAKWRQFVRGRRAWPFTRRE